MSPHVVNGTTSKEGSIASVQLNSATLLKANPFASTLVDPASLTGYTSAQTIISQAIYSVSSKVFSYETPGASNLLDSHISLWATTYKRPNAFGIVPVFHRLEVRSGASNTVLGYYSKNGTSGQPLTILSSGGALKYMQPTLAKQTSSSLPLSLQVSAVDFVDSTLVSNYSAPLNVARALGYSVVTPVDSSNGLELQHLTLLNHYLASLTGNPSVHLFDGPEFAKTYAKYSELLTLEQVGQLYSKLLSKVPETFSNLEQAVEFAFKNLNDLTGKAYSQFEYIGDSNAETVFVVYGLHESSQLLNFVSQIKGQSIGLIQIRVPLPFNVVNFVNAIPASATKLVVLSAEGGNLKGDITASLYLGGAYHRLSVQEFNYPLNFTWTPITIAKLITEFVPELQVDSVLSHPVEAQTEIIATSAPSGKYIFWGKDNGVLVDNSDKLALAFSLDSKKHVTLRIKFDNGAIGGGIFQSQISLSSTVASSAVDSADVIILEDLTLLEEYDILATAKPGATILFVNGKPIKTSVEIDIVEKLPIDFKKGLAANHNSLWLVDLSLLPELEGDVGDLGTDFLVQWAFWKKAFPAADNGILVNKLLQANGNDFELLGSVLDTFISSATKAEVLREVTIEDIIEDEPKVDEPKEDDVKDEQVEVQEEVKLPAFFLKETSFFPNPRSVIDNSEESFHTTSSDVAVKLAFPEAFGVSQTLRPDLPVKNFVVKVQENKRLTPTEYDRNIFHIEFDTTGTDLKYSLGESLGIHGRNPLAEVNKFLEFYGVNGESLVQVTNKDDSNLLEIRTARQALSENVDFLGKPPKRFYEALSVYATDLAQEEHLQKLGSSAEGAVELKKRQDVDCDTYLDLLVEFSSARPPFAELINVISPLKRREYSIALSQKVHTNAIHLLIVVVDWVDPKGRLRYGHCSKFLTDLKVGEELVVSVKASVMKLPPLSTQPIVMSGLGTGLAPFKAFIEEKIWQKQQGLEIGEVYLFLGSRHKKEEYLYGELWEAYKDAGILTHIGAAFSRDQPEKIYIQDRIKESIEDLTDAIVAKNGSFYLCGPTWPVPDITECLELIVKNGGKRAGVEIKDAAKIVEEMKEDGRYVLEVY